MHRPLEGLRVLLTRPAEQQVAWAEALRAAGAFPVAHPTIAVRPPPSWEPLDECLARLDAYDWLVFTSATTVRFTLSRLSPERRASVAKLSVAAVGPETARALTTLGVEPAVVPAQHNQDGLLAALGPLRPGTRVLFPQALGGREELRNELARAGCIVDVVVASQTIPIQPLPPLPPFDVATFASPSALRAFAAGHGLDPLRRALVAVLGPTTLAAARALGLPAIAAARATVDALIAAIVEHRTNGAP
jgi:uroporphyrinogen-III synthase